MRTKPVEEKESEGCGSALIWGGGGGAVEGRR
jgi:hypothetical protein